MGSFQDAMKKAGLATEAETPETSSEAPPNKNEKNEPAEKHEAREQSGERKPRGERPPRGDRPPRGEKPPAEKLEDKPCAKCGTVFTPKHSKHRLCPKCAEEHFTANKEKEKTEGAAKPEGAAERPAPAAKSERRERPPRPQRQESQRESPREREREAPQGFPSDYLRSGYFQNGVMRDELFDTWARHVAALLVNRGLTALQVRAFYSHVKRAEASAKAGRDFREVREELQRMRPLAAARAGRKMIPNEFADFLDRNAELVNDPKSLRAFTEHFQAVVGYTAGRLRR